MFLDPDILVASLQQDFLRMASLEKGEAMSAYMKQKFVFLGISAQERRQIFSPYLKLIKKSYSIDQKWFLVNQLWDQECREYHYCALDVLGTLKVTDYRLEDCDHIYSLLTTHAWWDSVDFLSAHILGMYLKAFPHQTKEVIESFVADESFWVRRSCLIFQLFYREATHANLLFQLIDTVKDDKEFFIQKAIGWSLRQFGKTNPQAVKEFLVSSKLKGLALREASKYL